MLWLAGLNMAQGDAQSLAVEVVQDKASGLSRSNRFRGLILMFNPG
jgi:hypothetical protein